MGAVKRSGLALILALAGSVAMGGQAALADATIALPAAPAPDAVLSHGIGTAPQVVVLSVPDQGHDGLLDADGNLVDSLAIDGVGTYQIDVDGILTFRPALGYVGTHSVVYRAIDAFDQTGDGTYTPEVDEPAAPAAPTLDLLGHRTALSSRPPSTSLLRAAPFCSSRAAPRRPRPRCPASASFRIDSASGALTFAPAFGYHGNASISYQVTDAYGQSTTGAYTASVSPPQPPVALPATTRGAAKVQQVVRISVTNGTTLDLVDPAGSVSTHVYLPGQGNYAVDPATASITFTPGQGFVGAGSLTYQLTDAYGQVSQSAYTPVVLRTPARTVKRQHTVDSHHATTTEPHRRPPLASAVLVPPLVLTRAGSAAALAGRRVARRPCQGNSRSGTGEGPRPARPAARCRAASRAGRHGRPRARRCLRRPDGVRRRAAAHRSLSGQRHHAQRRQAGRHGPDRRQLVRAGGRVAAQPATPQHLIQPSDGLPSSAGSPRVWRWLEHEFEPRYCCSP